MSENLHKLIKVNSQDIMRGLNALATVSSAIARDKGFHESFRGFPEKVALMHSELSEALESNRNGEPKFWFREEGSGDDKHEAYDVATNKWNKPEGELSELVDAVIRIADHFGEILNEVEFPQLTIAKLHYNADRPRLHGKSY